MRLMTWRALSMSPYRAGPAPDPERWLPLRERQSYRGRVVQVDPRLTPG